MSYNPQRVYNTFTLATPQFKLTPLGGLAIARPWDNNNKSSYFAGASFSFNIAGNRLAAPLHPVTWFNVKTKKPAINLQMLADTGADYSTLDSKHAPALGVDLTKGLKATVTGTGGAVENAYYIHQIPFQIGNLAPRMGLVAMGKGGGGMDVLGRTSALNYYNVIYTQGKTIKYTELAPVQAAYSQANWRNRI